MTVILGLSAFYHDSAAALLIDGEIAAAAHEERFTRKKHDSSFPINAVRYVLQEAGLVEISKGYERNRPHTTCRLTKTGRRRFLDYLAVLEQLVRDAAKAAGKDTSGARLGALPV